MSKFYQHKEAKYIRNLKIFSANGIEKKVFLRK
jgi:hypothetical protein